MTSPYKPMLPSGQFFIEQHKRWYRENADVGKLIDLTGKTFGSLTVLRRGPDEISNGSPTWECRCECTRLWIVRGASLRGGITKSCGCKQGNHTNGRARHTDEHVPS